MQLIQGMLGNAYDLVFPRNTTLRETVALNGPASRVHVFLRGFEVGYHGTDRNLNRLQVMLEVVSGTNSSQVDVIARVTLQDESPVGELIQVAVYYTVLAG